MSFFKRHWRFLIPIIMFGGTAVDVSLQADPITVKLNNPQQIVWNKPTTDAGWAEDVKKENLDIKSTDVLHEMLISQQNNLGEVQSRLQRYTDCPPCIRQDIKNQMPNRTESEITNEFNRDFNNVVWLHEKIQQSIERILHEIDLRNRHIVIPDKLDKIGHLTPQSELQRVDPTMIRHIND